MNTIVFTPLNRVNFINGGSRTHKSEKAFLNIMHGHIESDRYDITYNSKDRSFVIMYDGEMYQVVLPTDVKVSLKTGDYKRLALELFKLVALKKKYNDAVAAKKKRNQRIKEIEDSGYSKLEKIEDYELYLTYLNEQSKLVKTAVERDLNNAKIRGILNVLTNPYNLTFHFNRFICELADKGKSELNEEQKAQLEIMLHEITSDYYKEIVSKSDELLILGSSTKPMNIIRRIVDAEEQVKIWLTGKVETKPIEKIEEPEVIVPDDLDELSEKLHNIMGGGK